MEVVQAGTASSSRWKTSASGSRARGVAGLSRLQSRAENTPAAISPPSLSVCFQANDAGELASLSRRSAGVSPRTLRALGEPERPRWPSKVSNRRRLLTPGSQIVPSSRGSATTAPGSADKRHLEVLASGRSESKSVPQVEHHGSEDGASEVDKEWRLSHESKISIRTEDAKQDVGEKLESARDPDATAAMPPMALEVGSYAYMPDHNLWYQQNLFQMSVHRENFRDFSDYVESICQLNATGMPAKAVPIEVPSFPDLSLKNALNHQAEFQPYRHCRLPELNRVAVPRILPRGLRTAGIQKGSQQKLLDAVPLDGSADQGQHSVDKANMAEMFSPGCDTRFPYYDPFCGSDFGWSRG